MAAVPTILNSSGPGQPAGSAGPGQVENRDLQPSGGVRTAWEVLLTLTHPQAPGGVGVTALGDDHSARLFLWGFGHFSLFSGRGALTEGA